jgi:hypothetical protein
MATGYLRQGTRRRLKVAASERARKMAKSDLLWGLLGGIAGVAFTCAARLIVG